MKLDCLYCFARWPFTHLYTLSVLSIFLFTTEVPKPQIIIPDVFVRNKSCLVVRYYDCKFDHIPRILKRIMRKIEVVPEREMVWNSVVILAKNNC